MSDKRSSPVQPLKPLTLVEKFSEAEVPTERGPFRMVVFKEKRNGREHMALVRGQVEGLEGVPVRVHSECLTSEVFGSLKCDCRKQLDKAVLTDAERRQRRAQLTPDVERIVARAMHKEAARRYGSASELADDIRRYLDGQPVLAHPDSALYRAGKFMRRHRIGVFAASVAVVAILAASGVAFWQARVARQAAADMAEINGFLLDVLGSVLDVPVRVTAAN